MEDKLADEVNIYKPIIVSGSIMLDQIVLMLQIVDI